MLVVNILGLLLIALIIWWFWLYKPIETEFGENDFAVVIENGVYQPARIKLPSNEPVTLQFFRKDESPCSETLLIPGLEISETLPLNKAKNVQLPAMTSGEYAFHCQMQMYRGTLVVD